MIVANPRANGGPNVRTGCCSAPAIYSQITCIGSSRRASNKRNNAYGWVISVVNQPVLAYGCKKVGACAVLSAVAKVTGRIGVDRNRAVGGRVVVKRNGSISQWLFAGIHDAIRIGIAEDITFVTECWTLAVAIESDICREWRRSNSTGIRQYGIRCIYRNSIQRIG